MNHSSATQACLIWVGLMSISALLCCDNLSDVPEITYSGITLSVNDRGQVFELDIDAAGEIDWSPLDERLIDDPFERDDSVVVTLIYGEVSSDSAKRSAIVKEIELLVAFDPEHNHLVIKRRFMSNTDLDDVAWYFPDERGRERIMNELAHDFDGMPERIMQGLDIH